MATLLQDFKVAMLEEKCDRINTLIRAYNEKKGKNLELIDPSILAVLDPLSGDEFTESYDALDSVIDRISVNIMRLYESTRLTRHN